MAEILTIATAPRTPAVRGLDSRSERNRRSPQDALGQVPGSVGSNGSPPRPSGVAAILRPSAIGLRFSSRMPFEIWSALGPRIATRANSSRWWLGDWLVFGSRHYGSRYRDAIQATGLDYQTLRNYAVVARRFELSRRRDNLSFQHHAEVCALPAAQQERWLNLAAECRWSKQELRLRIRREMRIEQDRSDPHVLRFSVDVEHEQRWREAAGRCQRPFSEWVVEVLDRAAGSLDEFAEHLTPEEPAPGNAR